MDKTLGKQIVIDINNNEYKELTLRLDYVNYDFAANPFGAFCLNSDGKLYSYDYYVYYGYVKSPNGEICFILDEGELFTVELDKLPDGVKQILFFVCGLYVKPSDLILELKGNDDTVIQEMIIPYDFINTCNSFEVARFFRNDSGWQIVIEPKETTGSYLEELCNQI